MVLDEYKEIVGTAAGIVTVAQIFSPVFICWDILKQGSSNHVDPTPFIGGIGISILNFKYGLMLKDLTMIAVNIIAIFLNIIYFIIYYTHAKEKEKALINVGKVVAGAAILLGYAAIDSHERSEFIFGMIITVLMFILIGSPLLNLREIIASKNTGTLPFPLILSGTVVTSLWLLYGIIIENIFLQVQNVVALLLCGTQLSLFVIYPSKSIKKD